MKLMSFESLDMTGFKHGNYVHVKCLAFGIMELHSSDSETAANAQ